jgi:cAMP-dependent protein kinase regulator
MWDNVHLAGERDRMLRELFENNELFQPFRDTPQQAVLSSHFSLVQKLSHQDVIPEGVSSDGLYVIGRGSCEVVRHVGGQEQLLATLGPGAVFGEMSLLLSQPAGACVRTVETSAFLFMSREDFHQLIVPHPKVRAMILRLGQERLRANAAKMHGK